MKIMFDLVELKEFIRSYAPTDYDENSKYPLKILEVNGNKLQAKCTGSKGEKIFGEIKGITNLINYIEKLENYQKISFIDFNIPDDYYDNNEYLVDEK
jgi:hypothetical protein